MIPISPDRNYPEMRFDRDDKPEAMSGDLWANVASIILENISDMCVGGLRISPLSTTYTYKRLPIDLSLFHQIPTPFRRRSRLCRGGGG